MTQHSSQLWHCSLGVRKGIWSAKIDWWGGHGYLSGAKCKRSTYDPADATATRSFLASLKSRMVYLSGAGLPSLSWKRGH